MSGGCDPRVRHLLVCPKCRGELVDSPGGLRCPTCALLYPVVEGVPWMLVAKAQKLPRPEPKS